MVTRKQLCEALERQKANAAIAASGFSFWLLGFDESVCARQPSGVHVRLIAEFVGCRADKLLGPVRDVLIVVQRP